MKNNIDELMVKKLSGEISEEEMNVLDEWCRSAPENRQVYEKTLHYWQRKGNFVQSRKSVWQEIQQNIATQPGRSKKHSPKGKKRVWPGKFSKVAAAVALLVMVSAVWWLPALNHSLSVATDLPGQAVPMLEKQTLPGSKLNLKLPDGTTIKLNAGSKLRFPEHFTGKIREVYLEGEAFFNVAHDPSRPFIIHAGKIETRVLGTSFNVKAHDSLVQVVVVTGKVSVTHKQSGDIVVLPPNRMATCNTGQEEITASKADPELLAWKEGVIVFDRASFNEIESRLANWFGVTFEIKKDVKLPGGFTARFNKQSLENILESISWAGKFNYRIEGKKVTVY